MKITHVMSAHAQPHTITDPGFTKMGRHPPLQAAGGIPMQTKYCTVSMHARNRQYLGQISAMAFLRRLYITAIKVKA